MKIKAAPEGRLSIKKIEVWRGNLGKLRWLEMELVKAAIRLG